MKNRLEELIIDVSVNSRYNIGAVSSFAKYKVNQIDISDNQLLISDYFIKGNGPYKIKKKLQASNKLLHDDLYDNYDKHLQTCHLQNLYVKDYEHKLDFEDNIDHDFMGMYIFICNGKPFYVGISRSVLTRIGQHVKRKSKNEASLAYKIGTKYYEISDSRSAIDTVQEDLKSMKVKLVRFYNDDVLYLSEVMMSLKLNTPFNSFKTH